MTEHFWLGMGVVFVGGVLNGSFPLPMKYARWRWENTWLVFVVVALVLIPWVLALGFVPHLGQVYSDAPPRALLAALVFGFLWGIAQTTFGIGLKALGMALAFSVVAGLGALFGSLLPLLVLSPPDLFRPRGLLLMTSIPILLLGLYLYAKAGRRRDAESHAARSPDEEHKMSFAAGLAICIFTGVVGTCWNLGFAFSGGLVRTGAEFGATPVTSAYSVWPLLLGAGSIPNFLYCGYLLTRNRGWAVFARQGWPREVFLGAAMAILWLSGIVMYGMGATLVGKYGTSVGFALFVSAVILASNSLGVVTGEWRGTTPLTRRLLYVAVGIIILSVLVLSLGGLFSG
jgi:L-rhamnose-H+ transport protein